MKRIKNWWLLLFLFIVTATGAQTVTVKSPDNSIVLAVINDATLSWSVLYKGKTVINTFRASRVAPPAVEVRG